MARELLAETLLSLEWGVLYQKTSNNSGCRGEAPDGGLGVSPSLFSFPLSDTERGTKGVRYPRLNRPTVLVELVNESQGQDTRLAIHQNQPCTKTLVLTNFLRQATIPKQTAPALFKLAKGD